MGITNLLPYVKSACRPIHISDLEGSTVAVDISCWLHRGVFGCIQHITDGVDTDFYVQYCRKYLNVLLKHNIRVILVFDGRCLPAKQQTNEKRSDRKEKLRQEAKRLSEEGRSVEAFDLLKQTTHVTFEMVHKVIAAFCNVPNVDCLVSPYESDAQLTYLCAKGIANAVVTEDSDLIPFGCKRIVFKLDVSGSCVLYERKRLHFIYNLADSSRFDFEKFRRTCILAGCDYLLNGLPGVGLVKATKFFSITNCRQLNKVLPKIRYYLKMPKLQITSQFIDDFIRAEETFLYQIVFDPLTREQLPLTPYPAHPDKADYTHAGVVLAPDLAVQLASGAMHTRTMRPVKRVYSIDKIDDENSIWHTKYVPKSTPKKRSPQKSPQKKPASALVVAKGKSPFKRVIKAVPRTTPVKLCDTSSGSGVTGDQILCMYGITPATCKPPSRNLNASFTGVRSPYFSHSVSHVNVEASEQVQKAFKVPRFTDSFDKNDGSSDSDICVLDSFTHVRPNLATSAPPLRKRKCPGTPQTSIKDFFGK